MGLILSKTFKKKKAKVLMVGLDTAGKTTLLYKLKLDQVRKTNPTCQFNVETIKSNKMKFEIWDVGGRKTIRNLWPQYFKDIEAVIYVVDSSDPGRMEEARLEMDSVVWDPLLREIKVLIFANKQDIPYAMKPEEIKEKLNLTVIRQANWHIQPSCAITGEGLRDGLAWLATCFE